MQKNRGKIISPFLIFSLVVFLVTRALSFLSGESVYLADYLNSTLCHAFRRIMASFGDLFDFSLVEVIVILLPLIIIFICIYAARTFSRGGSRVRFIGNILAVAMLLLSGHTIALGIAYKTTPVSEKMELSEVEITEERLYELSVMLRDEVNSLASEVSRDGEGVFVFDLGMDYLSEEICRSYEALSEKYSLPKAYSSRIKGVRNPPLMSYLEITGVYTYFTGEATVNTGFPAYDMVFAAAHEASHQRGILRENEANFMAYLICKDSENTALRYSGALTILEYISSALYKTSPDSYYEVMEELCTEARYDMRASRAVIEKYSDTFIGELSNKFNDFFLKSNGTDGVVTYGRVVHLVVSYYYS